METTTFIEGVRSDLRDLTTGDEAATSAMERLSRAIEPSLRVRLMDLMGQAALELSDQIPGGHVEVRLAGRDVQLVMVQSPEPDPAPSPGDDEKDLARLTLRVPDALKTRMERAADREGVSTNTWLVHAVKRALDSTNERRRSGNRITGFAQS